MKYLVVVLVVLIVGWLLLRPRKNEPTKAPQRAQPEKPSLQEMLQCRHCGVHLPRAEALVDERGAFCSEAHRLAGPREG